MKKIIIDESYDLDRLDKVVMKEEEDKSRSTIKKMIEEGFITVNDHHVKANYTVKINDVINITDFILEQQTIEAEDIPLNIVYQDDDILIINKPSGMVVHPGAGVYSKTLVNALMFHIKDLSRINGEVRPGIVHRIDKDTSGLLVVAKNDRAHNILASQLVDKTLNRTYLALVHNQIFDENIVIDAPIGRDKNDRTKMAVTSHNSKHALTKVKVLDVFENSSFVQCNLETGRTHQIRVHLAFIKHPIYGDPKYGYRRDNQEYGQYLHAYKLGLVHPTTNEYMEFEVEPEPEFTRKLEELKLEKNIS
ncbi:RluA family pseudouridine synthase [Mycoplasma sp. P36-A1]|uniref:RluA family pseudouridine synthase n=1 Tax=Mycoplasma sp. P36-A1 TaxID=3252900 RepID=UPI003C2FFA6D